MMPNAQWEACSEMTALEAMRALFSPIVKGLNVAEFVAEDVPADGVEGGSAVYSTR